MQQYAHIRFVVDEYDAVPTQLNLFIDTAFKENETVTEPGEFSGLIRSLAPPLEESARCEIRPADVPRTHVWPGDNDSAALVRGQFTAILVDHEDLRPRHRAAHGQS